MGRDVIDARRLIRQHHVWYGREGEPPRLMSTHSTRREAEAAITAYLGVSYFVDEGFGGMNELEPPDGWFAITCQ